MMEFRDSYCNIQGWMITDLKLTGNELITYAVIYGFCRDGQNWYKLSQEHVARWSGITTRGLRKILTNLKEKGLLKMRNDGSGGCSEYMTIKPERLPDSAELSSGEVRNSVPEVRNSVPGVRNSVPEGEELSSYPTSNNINNNINNINNNKENIKRKNEVFKKPTLEEITAYIQERKSPIDPETFYAYYESVGWIVGKKHMKNWKMAIITWEKKRETERKENSKTERTYGSDKPEGFDFFDF